MPDFSDPASAWQVTLGQLQLQIPREHFNTFLRPTIGVEFDEDGNLVVGAASKFSVSWLELPLHLNMAQEALTTTLGRDAQVRYQAMPSAVSAAKEANDAEVSEPIGVHAVARAPSRKTGLFGIPPPLPGATFENYELHDHLQGGVRTLEDLRSWASAPVNFFIIVGPPGVGKTHLAVSAARACSKRDEVLFVEWHELLDMQRQNIAARSDGRETPHGWQGEKHPYHQARILVLDDLCAPRNDWPSEILRSIVKSRYDAGDPTLITTNVLHGTWDTAFGADVASRMMDRELSRVYYLVGPDYRLRSR